MFLLYKIILFIALFSYSYSSNEKSKPTLLFYCGITMVKPMKEIAKVIEKKHNSIIKISQGGSKDLSDSLLYSKKGDLFLPGSDSYVKKIEKEGFILESKDIGFNQAAIFVQKGNPKNISSLKDFERNDVTILLSNPNSGSIGRMTKKIFLKYRGKEFYNKIFDESVEIRTDSRSLNKSLRDKNADITINWKASSLLKENKDYIDVVNLDDNVSPKKRLILSILSFSKNKNIAKDFLDYVTSKEGRKIMKKYGFSEK